MGQDLAAPQALGAELLLGLGGLREAPASQPVGHVGLQRCLPWVVRGRLPAGVGGVLSHQALPPRPPQTSERRLLVSAAGLGGLRGHDPPVHRGPAPAVVLQQEEVRHSQGQEELSGRRRPSAGNPGAPQNPDGTSDAPPSLGHRPLDPPSLSQRPGPGGQQEPPGPLLKPSEQDRLRQQPGPWRALWCTTGALWGVAGGVTLSGVLGACPTPPHLPSPPRRGQKMKREAWDSPRLPRLFRVRDADQTGFSNKNKCHMTVFSGAGWAQAGGARQPHPCPVPAPPSASTSSHPALSTRPHGPQACRRPQLTGRAGGQRMCREAAWSVWRGPSPSGSSPSSSKNQLFLSLTLFLMPLL